LKTLVLGLGNPIRGDDSVGLVIAGVLEDRLRHPEVTVIAASAAGLDILDLLTGYDRAIIIDAIQTGEGEVGHISRLGKEAFDATRHTATPHDVNFATALELGRRLGLALPQEITIFAIEIEASFDFSEECSPEVKRAIPLCVDRVLKELQDYQERKETLSESSSW
jgi:hydrogenase maturation protease